MSSYHSSTASSEDEACPPSSTVHQHEKEEHVIWTFWDLNNDPHHPNFVPKPGGDRLYVPAPLSESNDDSEEQGSDSDGDGVDEGEDDDDDDPCLCGHCPPNRVDGNLLCCQRFDFEDDQCVTKDAALQKLLKDKDVMALVSCRYDKQFRRPKEHEVSKWNALMRHTAYGLCLDTLRLRNCPRTKLPSCYVGLVRNLFPDPLATYTGYKEGA